MEKSIHKTSNKKKIDMKTNTKIKLMERSVTVSRKLRHAVVVAAFPLAAVVLSVCAQGAATLPYTAQEVLRFHQSSFAVATDLHVKFWQKEDDINITSWDVTGTSGGLPMPDSEKRGEQPGEHHSMTENFGQPPQRPGPNPDNGQHAVDLDWNTLSVPYCTWVDIGFKWTLTEKNRKYHEIQWTNGGAPVKLTSGNGWEVDDPVWFAESQWLHRVHILNTDDPNDPSAMPLYVSDLRFWGLDNYDYLTKEDLENWILWTDAPMTTFTLLPGTEYVFDVVTGFGWNGHILGQYNALDATGGAVLVGETFDHPNPVPEPSQLLHCAAIVAFGILIRHRTKRP